MPLKPDQEQEISEYIATKFDMVAAFNRLDEVQRAQIAADLESRYINIQMQKRKPRSIYTPRITVSGADINLDELGNAKGHAGPTLPRTIDFVSATGTLDSTDPSIVRITN